MAYAVTSIRRVPGGDEYERSPEPWDEVFEDEADAEEILHESVADMELCDVYEIGWDELPEGVEDIGGLIHGGDPIRLYAVSESNGTVSYLAVDRV